MPHLSSLVSLQLLTPDCIKRDCSSRLSQVKEAKTTSEEKDENSSLYSEEDEDLSSEEELSFSENENWSEEESELEEESDVDSVASEEEGAAWDDAYHTDTSDEEELRNTVGNIPLHWYDDYPHIGYDQDGKKVLKPAKGDELDEFLRKMDDPNYWRTVNDKVTGKEIQLTDEELDLIHKMQNADYPSQAVDPYAPYVDFFTNEKLDQPLSHRPEPKRRFLPSMWEHREVMKIVKAIKNGWIKPKPVPEQPSFYMLWSDTNQSDTSKQRQYIPAPKVRPPGHAESYNPPPEFLPTEDEIKEWKSTDPEERSSNFLPKQYSRLRQVPGYSQFIQERFERCLDLYLCPRKRIMRVQVDPETLIPKLPKPRDLQPFPSSLSVEYKGHTGLVRCIAVEPLGKWLASGGDDESLRLWEIATGRCMQVIPLSGKPTSLSFCPNNSLLLLTVSVDKTVMLLNHGLGDRLLSSATDAALLSDREDTEPSSSNDTSSVKWELCSEEKQQVGFRLCLEHSKAVKQVTWHFKGDYFASVVSEGGTTGVFVHQLSKRRSQNPFHSLKGQVQKVVFHPSRPFFFVATQRYVRVYNLVKQELAKKLMSGVRWISSIDIHPLGDNLIIGSYDKRLCWFDMDLSTKPYKTLRNHQSAIRQVCYHPRYPLFASCSDDGSVIIFHGMVYNDLMQNPLIVPVKVLKHHKPTDGLCVTDCQFHPSQPWLISAGADGRLLMYS